MKFAISKSPTPQEFVNSLKEKQDSPLFLGDMEGLLSSENTIRIKPLDGLRRI